MAAQKPEMEFSASEFLQSQGLELVGGTLQALKVRDKQGQEFEFSPAEYLKAQGVDASKVLLKANDPKSALPESPVSWLERGALALGNERGNVEFLKRKFEGVQVDPDHGIVVRDKGIWKKVDPSVIKDPWSFSEAIADVVEGGVGMAVQAVGQTVGAAKGAAAAAPLGPAGVVAGGVLGAAVGSGAGEGVRTYLGKIAGTYDATPEEQLQDMGIEALAGAAGQALAVGARPTWQWFKGVMGKIGDKASEGAKSAYAAFYGRLTGAGDEATRIMFDYSDDMTKQMIQFKAAGAKNSGDIIRMGAERQVQATTQLMKKATQALPQKYGEMLGDLMAQGQAKNMSVDVGEVIDQARRAWVDSGFGTLDKAGFLRPLTPSQIAERLTSGQEVEVGTEAIKGIQAVARTLNNFSKLGKLQGKAAVKALTTMNKVLNQIERDVASDPANAQLARAMKQAVAGFKNGLGAQFKKAGLSGEYNALAALYGKYGEAVTQARQILGRDGAEGFTNKLLHAATTAGKQVKARGQAQLLVELVGAEGESLFKDVVITEATKRFAPIMPKMGFFQSGLAVGAAGGAISGGISAPAAIALGTQASPAFVRKQTQAIKYLGPAVSHIKSVGVHFGDFALKDPNYAGAVFSQALQAVGAEDAITSQLLNQAGVTRGK